MWLIWTLHNSVVRRWGDRHPWLAARIRQRFDTTQFFGLAATILVCLFVYLMFAYLDSVSDFVGSADVSQIDEQLANTHNNYFRLMRINRGANAGNGAEKNFEYNKFTEYGGTDFYVL